MKKQVISIILLIVFSIFYLGCEDSQNPVESSNPDQLKIKIFSDVHVASSIGDFVWEDLNKNGIQDQGELGVEGVVVKIYHCDGTFFKEDITDITGHYLFYRYYAPDSDPNDFYLEFILPAGYVFTSQDQGADDAVDSDVDPTTGKTICETLELGEHDLTWDAGIYAEEPPEPECETAFAWGDGYATCFIDLGFGNWGWTNGPLSAGNYTFDVYAGAGQCDRTKGTLVGDVTVDYDGSTATVTYNMDAGFTMSEVHLFVGDEELPRDKEGRRTNAPGKYTIVDDDLNNSNSESYTVSELSGDIYVIAHAVVCGNY